MKHFQAPNLSLPEGFSAARFSHRFELLDHLDAQCRELDEHAQTVQLDRHRQDAISMLTDPRVKQAFDVMGAEPKVLERYGRNSFGWSLLMARLVEAGVNLVQVNLGNNETWDTHGNAFPNLDSLFPPTDRALSALLDDLHASGLLDSTLIVMAGEFGRTPKISTLPSTTRSRDATIGVPCRPCSSPAAECGRTGHRLHRQDAATPSATRRRPKDGRDDLPIAGHSPDSALDRRAGPPPLYLPWRANRRPLLTESTYLGTDESS